MRWNLDDAEVESERVGLVRLPPGWRRGGPFSRRCQACSCLLRGSNGSTRCSPCTEAGKKTASRVKRCIDEELEARFRASAFLGAVHWAWRGIVNNAGLPIIHHRRVVYQARRVSWTLHRRGGLPDGLSLVVKCGVKTCTRPDHLGVRFRPREPASWLSPRPAGKRWLPGFPRDKTGNLVAGFVREFLEMVRPNGNGCHLWTGRVNTNGVPLVCKWGGLWTARRVAYEIDRDHLPAEKIFSTCGNNLCVNPEHLIDTKSKLEKPPCPGCGGLRVVAYKTERLNGARVRWLRCECGNKFGAGA